MFKSTKTYGTDLGISATFRQWKASSHCQYLHGYALGFRFVFGASQLDNRNWVVDFGSLKTLKESIVTAFDHKLIIAEDDPQKEDLLKLARLGLIQPTMMSAVGCEAFARWGFTIAEALVNDERVQVLSCECFEHGANSAIYEQPFNRTIK